MNNETKRKFEANIKAMKNLLNCNLMELKY